MTITKESWRDLCRQAAIERDPRKLIKLYDEINSILQHAGDASGQTSSTEKPAGADGRLA